MHLCKNLWSSDCNRSNELCVIDSMDIHSLNENESTKCARNENCKIIVLNFLKYRYAIEHQIIFLNLYINDLTSENTCQKVP